MRDDEILDICTRYFRDKNIRAWVVGGYVRDSLLKRTFSGDIDIALPGNTLPHGKALARLLKGTMVPLSKAFGITRVALKNGATVDLSKFRGKSIEEDLLKRDFTINALAFCVFERKVILDPSGGLKDLHKHTVRMVSKAALLEDPVRLLRAFRFSATLSFTIEDKTLLAISNHAEKLASPASERIRDEILKLLTVNSAAAHIVAADRAGILTGIFPELSATKGVGQPGYHHLDVFNHTLECLAQLEINAGLSSFKLDEETRIFILGRLNRKLGQFTSLAHLKLAALFHDIAKPETKTPGTDGGAHFYNHEIKGSKVFAAAGKRLKLSNLEIAAGVSVIRNHLRVGYLAGLKSITKRALYRFLRDSGDFTAELLLLSWADRLSARGPKVKKTDVETHRQLIARLFAEYYKTASAIPLPKLIDGNAVMKKFKLKPGKPLGELLDAVKEAQAIGNVTTRKEAFDLIKELLRS